MKNTVLIVILLITVSGCGGNDEGNEAEINACVSRGVSYFKVIGSYPKLSSGKAARAVARERCKRTTTAF